MEKQKKKEQLGKKVTAATLVAIGVLGLAACGNDAEIDKSRSVEVVSQEYDDEDRVPHTTLVGKVPVTRFSIDPEHFNLKVEQCGFDPSQKSVDENGCVSEQVEVSEEVYNGVKVGEEIVLDGKTK